MAAPLQPDFATLGERIASVVKDYLVTDEEDKVSCTQCKKADELGDIAGMREQILANVKVLYGSKQSYSVVTTRKNNKVTAVIISPRDGVTEEYLYDVFEQTGTTAAASTAGALLNLLNETSDQLHQKLQDVPS